MALAPELLEFIETEPMPQTIELAGMRLPAFRAVAQDDGAGLADILEKVPVEVWQAWTNKGGTTLLALSEDRGSSTTYGVLVKALGMVSELTRDLFQEQESVWVFEAGNVVARRATVLEDAPIEMDDVLVEFWDGVEEPKRVPRCLLRKSH